MRSMAPASRAMTPAAVRNAGALTSSASSSGSPSAAETQTASPPIAPPIAAEPRDLARRAAGARDPERGPGRVQRQQQRERPEPARRRVVVGGRRAALRRSASVRRSAARACCWSSMRVSPSSKNQAPSTRDRVAGGSGVRAVGLRIARRCPATQVARVGDRALQVGEPRFGSGGAPEAGEALVDHAVPAAAEHVGCRGRRLPTARSAARPSAPGRPTARPAGARRPARLGERRAAALGEAHGLGQPVVGPVVGDRRPVVLGLSSRSVARYAPMRSRPRRSPRPGTSGAAVPAPSTSRPCSTWSTRRAPGASRAGS